MSNADEPANPLKLNERVECPSTGDISINECDDYFSGLTKREAFAVAAMQGLCANQYNIVNNDGACREVARNAAAMADALLKELEGKL